MAPTATTPEATAPTLTSIKSGKVNNTRSSYKEPLVSTGSLDSFTSFEVTPTIGREYPTLQLSDVMSSPNRDNLVRDLAITGEFLASCPSLQPSPALPTFLPGVLRQNLATTNQSHIVSQRGVVFLRGQSSLTVEMQKEFIDLLGKLSGRPATSGLHVHPLIEGKRDVGVNEKNEFDEKISVISSQLSQKLDSKSYGERYTNAKKGWHSEFVLVFFFAVDFFDVIKGAEKKQ